MGEIERAKGCIGEEFKLLNDKITNLRRSSTRISGNIEAGMTISKYNTQLQELITSLELIEKFKGMGGADV